MDRHPLPLTQDIVLVGGGHSHALLLHRWGMNPLPGARLTVINPAPTAPYTGMLPGFVAGHYGRDDLEIDLVRLARFAGARIILGMVTGIDRAAKTLSIEGRGSIAYDVASIDIGITSDMPEVPGFTDFACAAKPLGPFAKRWQKHRDGTPGSVVVVGGGIAGTELAMAMRHSLDATSSVTVIEAETALRGVNAASRERLLDEIERQDITLMENARVAEVGPDFVTLENGKTISASLTVGAAGARPFAWLRDTGLDLTDGYITVDAALRSVNDPSIFAAGDCAHLSASPRPKAGVFAVRAAPILMDNLQAAVSGGGMRAFNPQAHYLKLVSLGRKSALADKWDRAIQGDWVWHWKDRIDRAFMNKLSNLPAMPRPALPADHAEGMEDALGDKPLCGGCGSKVGAGVLDGVLRDLNGPVRHDVRLGIGDDAAVLKMGDLRQVITTDHLRAFWSDPWLFARITALHALGDVWAMGAEPQAVLAQITLPPLSDTLQHRWMAEIMQAANAVFTAEGAVVAGGHSTIGAELTVGFTVTGVSQDPPITLVGAKSGDRLLMTRPIGSGVLLAGEMDSKTDGDDLAALLTTLATSQGDAARTLATRATALTDVTGFGLAGHLTRMAKASGLSVHLALDDVPLFAGAEDLAAQGLRSSIWAANKAALDTDLPDTPRADLLLDPQTAGGLLAALPAEHAEDMLREVQAMGHQAALIGVFEPKTTVTLSVS